MADLADILHLSACPRCDKTPLALRGEGFRCAACRIDFPSLAGIPWLFAAPDASLGEWQNRLKFALARLGHDSARIAAGLERDDLHALTRRRLERCRDATDTHRASLQALLEPLVGQTAAAGYETYLALRTRLPVDQGLDTYYANVHRDWAWGDEENAAALGQVSRAADDASLPGTTLVVGAGASRLAYDVHMALGCGLTIAMDFNPLLLLVARAVTRGDTLELYEFPLAPVSLEDTAVLRTLSAPESVREGFHLVAGDALRAPFAAGSFDTVITPWLIDILGEDLPSLARRMNRLLKTGGRWINFGSLAYAHPEPARRYSREEVAAIVGDSGFTEPVLSEATIPYMCSPSSRHGRRERVLTFAAARQSDARPPPRHRALPDWLVTGKEPVPLLPSFQSQALTTRIYAYIMALIDGKRSIRDMAAMLEKQQLMPGDEAEPAIRSFLTRMYDDSERPSGL